MFNGTFEIYFSYLSVSYKFHHLQVPNGTFVAISQMVGIAGNQNIVERFLMVHLKSIVHI